MIGALEFITQSGIRQCNGYILNMKLPAVVLKIILDYKYQLEHAEKYKRVMSELRSQILFNRVLSLYTMSRSHYVHQQAILDWGWW